MTRPRLVGINHVALEVDDVEEAIEFFGRLFEIASIEREPGGASIEIGDQFIALIRGGPCGASGERRRPRMILRPDSL